MEENKTVPTNIQDTSLKEYPWGLFWIGVVINVGINVLGNINGYVVLDIIYIITGIFSLIYAAFLYPSLFKSNPKISSGKIISFLNGFCGSLIFGLCWQFNVKKNEKGVSNVVYVILFAVGFAASILIMFLYGFEAFLIN